LVGVVIFAVPDIAVGISNKEKVGIAAMSGNAPFGCRDG
jgi:hypothetical protein